MSHNKIINNPQSCVQDMLQGLKISYPALLIYPRLGLSLLNVDRRHKVALLSGGGSGHEPFAAGYVANNMLTGAVSGLVFTSPPVSNVLTGIEFLSKLNKGGVLVITMNYTGDQLNFGLAIERAKSKGILVESVTINDDCALLENDTFSIVGKRGICGSVVFKILGAMSDAGISLCELVSEYKEIEARLATMGACLQPCTLPNAQNPLFNLGDNEISLGCGVHGEAGIATIQMCSLREMVHKVLSKIFNTGILKFGKSVCILIGNLGTLTQMECLIIAKEVREQLDLEEVTVERLYVGTLMSSLDMKGFQISVLNTTYKPEWISLLDLPTEAFGWPGTELSCPVKGEEPEITLAQEVFEEQQDGLRLSNKGAKLFQISTIAACDALKQNKEKINELDSECGDGDCGTTLESLADAILNSKDQLPWEDVGKTFYELSRIAESAMGGTSGAVYSLLLQGAAKSSDSWHSAWSGALETLYKYSPARVGHRTLVDALAPACEVYNTYIEQHGLNEWKKGLKIAVQKADEGCQRTVQMKPKVGRATYAEPSRVVSMDAGAFGVTVWLNAIANELAQE